MAPASASALDVAARRSALLGIVQLIAGCLAGAMVVPPLGPPAWPRGMVSAHIVFTVNGVLQAVVGMLIPWMALSPTLLLWLEVLLFIGTWSNGGALFFAGLTGYASPLVGQMHKAFPAPALTDNCACHFLLLACGPTILGALGLAAAGLAKGKPATSRASASGGRKDE